MIENESDSLNIVNTECQKIWNEKKSMKNVFIVRIIKPKHKANKTKSVINELGRYWNIPCLSLYINDNKSKFDLFHFAVKYYWFCNCT